MANGGIEYALHVCPEGHPLQQERGGICPACAVLEYAGLDGRSVQTATEQEPIRIMAFIRLLNISRQYEQ